MAELPDDRIEVADAAFSPWAAFLKWAWRPLHAKIWWGLAATYWIMFFLSFYLHPLAWFQELLPLRFLFLVFHPFMMLSIMGFGTMERWWHSHDRGDWQPAERDHLQDQDQDLGPSGLHWDIDPLDPRSIFFEIPGHKIH